ncbi:TraG family conjugative transposon ATPase [Xanthocytophaga flava]|uniref:TraG family conjugative transposon ATPase n=1 Tax=Xanthocytophaga flava TaxID=3048013 RepID=UPI0028D82A55|nr:TraG family conjugative transposon ATPase [Xanthocytophaga flavus]MDJ1470227.1 TraG family conjugative transposon ATPase [Xanthocytophaga flavus]
MATKKRKIEEVFPIMAIENGLIISKNGDLTVPFELTMPEIFTLSSSDYDRMHQVFSSALRGFEENMIIHKQDWYLVEKYKGEINKYPESPTLLSKGDERNFHNREYVTHRCFLFITRPLEQILKKKSSHSFLLSPRLVPNQLLDPTYVHRIKEVASQFAYNLESSKLFNLRRLTDEELDYQLTEKSLYQKYFTLAPSEMAISDIDLVGELKVNGQYCSVCSIGELEEFPSSISNYTTLEKYRLGNHTIWGSLGYQVGMSLPFNHIYNQIFYIDNSQKIIKKLEAEANRMNSFSINSRQNEKNLEFKLSFIQKAVESNERVIRVHANVLTWSGSHEKMLKQRSEVTAGFTQMGFTPRNAVHDAAVLYWSCIPGNAGEIGKDNLAMCFSSEAACILALESNYTDKPYNKNGVKLVDRMGRPVSVDIFLEPKELGLIDNRNALVVGPSGSGKSFLVNLLLYHLLEQSTDIIMVDTGNSYKRLCYQLGGVYVNFDKDNPLSFNPFYFDTKTMKLEDIVESKQNIVSLLLALWKQEDEPVSKSEEVGLENIINAFYEHIENANSTIFPCFDSFFDFFREVFIPQAKSFEIREKDIDLLNFEFVMRRFYKDGYLGYLLNAGPDNQINKLLGERFVVFEMDNIKDNPTLHTVTTIAIMNLYVRKLMRDKSVFSMLVIEEAWRLVADPRFAKFLKWVAKTARKHFGSLVSVTQEPSDLTSPLVQEAIIKNSDIQILLDFSKYKKQSDLVQQILGLTDETTALLMSVNQGLDKTRGKYKEALISWKGHAKVYGVEVGKGSFATYTTDKEKVKAIENLKTQLGNYSEAIEAYINGNSIKGSNIKGSNIKGSSNGGRSMINSEVDTTIDR